MNPYTLSKEVQTDIIKEQMNKAECDNIVKRTVILELKSSRYESQYGYLLCYLRQVT